MSLGKLGIRLGLYRQHEVLSDSFRDSLFDWPEGVSAESYWGQISQGVYDPQKHNRSTFPDLHRILHLAAASAHGGRKDTTGGVPINDIFYLYGMFSGREVNVAALVLEFFTRCDGTRSGSFICGGWYATALAK